MPGDTPEGFRRTLDYALSLPAAVRAYHCLVLPDALMTRGLPDWDMRFDPRNLAMTSCLGWSEDAIAGMRDELDRRVAPAAERLGSIGGHFRVRYRPARSRSRRDRAFPASRWRQPVPGQAPAVEVPRRSGRRVALLARYPDRDPAMPQFIPNLGLYMVEAALRASRLPDLEVKVWDMTGGDADRIAAEVIAFDPDVVGCSVFLWSFGFFLDVAAAVKADDPGRLIVFGGPSARPVMLDHEPHRQKSAAVDLLVINEGEDTFREVVDLADRSPEGLMGIAGLAFRTDLAWHETKPRPKAISTCCRRPTR